MIINVTQEDIDNGKCRCPSNCAVALAFKRAFPDREPSVAYTFARLYTELYNDATPLTYRLPYEVGTFIEAFDNGDLVQPLSFEVAERT